MKAIRSISAAFSLVELLIVMGLVAVLAALALPGLSSLMRGSNLNRAGQMVTDQLALARQQAVSQNRDVQVRFYRLSDSKWRAIQLWRVDQGPNGTTTNAASRLTVFPDGVVIKTNDDLSPLITGVTNRTETLPAYGAATYAEFRFRGNGSLESSVGNSTAFLTLAPFVDNANPPANYYTIKLNPLTGKATVFRP